MLVSRTFGTGRYSNLPETFPEAINYPSLYIKELDIGSTDSLFLLSSCMIVRYSSFVPNHVPDPVVDYSLL